MKKQFQIIIFSFGLLGATSTLAQLKLNAAGLVSVAGGKSDPAYFSDKTGTAAHLNAAYYFGRIGIGAKGATIKHDVQKNQKAKIDTFIITRLQGGGQSAATFTLGPELCLCKGNIKITPSFKFGVTKIKGNGSKIFVRVAQGVEQLYETKQQDEIVFTSNPSITFAYKLNKIMGISFNVDHLRYRVPYLLSDFRTGFSQFRQKETKRSVTNLGIGLYTNF